MMELLLIAIAVVLGIGEFIVWYFEALWHEDRRAKGDARNWRPPR